MCTVTFIPVKEGVCITSNRDEKPGRLDAESPLIYEHDGVSLLYPKDKEKGGTWIAANKKGDAGVLLNGALYAHIPKPNYGKSRGLILPELLSSKDPVQSFSSSDLDEVEPFTLVLYIHKLLYECRWDGTTKTIMPLPADKAHIWSSSTLYDAVMSEKRKAWFSEWLGKNPVPDQQSIIGLHRYGGENNPAIDYVMNRNTVLTVSITSLTIDNKRTEMTYHSLKDDRVYRSNIHFSKRTLSQRSMWWRRFLIRLRHWEYWPFHVVYTPVYPYWIWLCIKARSFFFFTASNPTIRYGGFLMESKKEIYDLLPQGSYPLTVLVKKADHHFKHIKELLSAEELRFPLVAKPDIGLRGIGVRLVHSIQELNDYHQSSKVDYILQEYVPYQNEVGIFYCRFPGEEKGKITGIVGKQLLSITGNGVSTIAELMQKEQRHLLQLEAMRAREAVLLSQVLKKDESKLLVPYGNHSRGAMFIDLTDKIDDQLTESINALCLQIPGFYFGRLDIRYNTWKELCEGKNYSVIELNGAGSEPAHIYDPKHNIFFGWKEIMRHQHLLYRISKENRKSRNERYMSIREGINMFRENASYMKKIS